MTERINRERFVLRYGVLGYGGGLFLIFNALHLWHLHTRGASLAGLPLFLAITAAICASAGYLVGLYLWRRMTKRYRR